MSTFVLAALACTAENSTAPVDVAGIDDGSSVETPLADSTAAMVADFSASSRAPGIPFGDFHLPISQFANGRYSGSLQALSVGSAYSVLNAAARSGERLVVSLAGSRRFYTNANRTFNLTKWKARVRAFRGIALGRYVSSGAVIGHYLVDEPNCAVCWGGRKIPASALEEMARYSKSLWPTLPTAVRGAPTHLAKIRYRHLDFAWAQWVGPNHTPSRRQTPAQFRDNQTAAARARGLGLVLGMNYLAGGDGSSRIRGAMRGRWQMSAAEVKRVGAVLAASSYACAVLSWQYDTRFNSRPGMASALNYVSQVARNRSRSSCVK
jgi:hypothetical protein